MYDMQDNILAREIIFEKIRASLSSDCRKKYINIKVSNISNIEMNITI